MVKLIFSEFLRRIYGFLIGSPRCSIQLLQKLPQNCLQTNLKLAKKTGFSPLKSRCKQILSQFKKKTLTTEFTPPYGRNFTFT